MNLSMFRAMYIGLIGASALLVWEELEVTLHGRATLAQTAAFTAISLLALAVFAAWVARSPDN